MSVYGDRVLPHIINIAMNTKQNRLTRQRVCEGLAGDIVEIGFGTIELAQDRIAAASMPVEVVGLDGQRVSLPDDSADNVLCTWSLCTIPDAVAAVSEMRRVLRPGGALHFVEHGGSPHEKVRRWQDRLNGIQQRIAGGCNLNRDIPALIEAGGFTISRLDTYYAKGEPKPLGYLYEGIAR
jgi:SAM-dependent methyltransferase